MQVFDLTTGDTINVTTDGHVTSQCWSPSGDQFVYSDGGKVWLYNVQDRLAHILTNGNDPTWSPSGDWIAFADRDGYYAIQPNGEGRKLLFRRKNLGGGLVWSPDGHLVAYSSRANFFQSLQVIDVETYTLHIRRLADGSEYTLDTNISGTQFQWMIDSQFATSQK